MRACSPHNLCQSGDDNANLWRGGSVQQTVLTYCSQGVQTSFHESTDSAPGSLGNTFSQRSKEDSGNAIANIPNASKEYNLRNTSGYSRVLFEHIPGTQGFLRVGSSNRFKTTERPHRRTSLSHAHYKNRSAGCILSCTNTSRQQEVPLFCLRKQGISIPSTYFRSEHFPSDIYLSGAHSGAYLHRQGISVIQYLKNWLIHHPDRQVLLRHQSQLLQILNMVGLNLNEEKSELEPVQDIQYLGLRLRLDLGRASLPVSKHVLA